MLARACLAALFGFLVLAEFSGATQAQELPALRGKLWLVSNAGGLIAKRPVPEAAPDATFVTRHVSFQMTAPDASCTVCNNVNNSVEGFLSSSHPDRVPPVEDLAFSGLYNSAVGAVVDGNTPVVNSNAAGNGTYGTYMTLEGTIQLTNGQNIYITHDDGVSLWIDDARIPGFSDGVGDVLQGYYFTGLTGAHKIEIIYANVAGPGILSSLPRCKQQPKLALPRILEASSARFSPREGRDRRKFRKRRALGRSPTRFNSLRAVGFRGRPTCCLRLATGMSRGNGTECDPRHSAFREIVPCYVRSDRERASTGKGRMVMLARACLAALFGFLLFMGFSARSGPRSAGKALVGLQQALERDAPRA